MGLFSPGFTGRAQGTDVALPPGQHLTKDFPLLSAGPTPRVPLDQWQFQITTEAGQTRQWSWAELLALPSETPTVDIHCVRRRCSPGWKPRLTSRWCTDHKIEVTVPRVPDGEVSHYLVEVFSPGDAVEIRGPAGGWFVWRPQTTHRCCWWPVGRASYR